MAGTKKSSTAAPRSPMSAGTSGTYSAPRSPGTPGGKKTTGTRTGERKRPTALAPPPKAGRGKSPMKSSPKVSKKKALETIAACEGNFSGLKLLLQVAKPPQLMPVSVKPPSKKSGSPKVSPQKKKVSPRKRRVAKKDVHPKLLPPVEDDDDETTPLSPMPEGSPINKKVTSAAPARPLPLTHIDPVEPVPCEDDEQIGLASPPAPRRSSLQTYSLVPDACPMNDLPSQHHHLARILEACNQSPHALARAVNAMKTAEYDFHEAQLRLKRKVTFTPAETDA